MKMYNYIPMIFLFAIVVLLLTSCEQKEVMEYEGVDGIYFDVQWGPSHFDESRLARQHYTYVSFGSIGRGRNHDESGHFRFHKGL